MPWAEAEPVLNAAVHASYGVAARVAPPNAAAVDAIVLVHEPGAPEAPERLHVTDAATIISIGAAVIGQPPRDTAIITASHRYVVDDVEPETVGWYNLICRRAD